MQFYGFFPQLIDIENIENFHVKTLNGMAFDWKNYSFSPEEALLISSKKSLENLSICKVLVKALCQRNCIKSYISLFLIVSLKSVHFGNISDKYNKRYETLF